LSAQEVLDECTLWGKPEQMQY